MEVSKLEMTAKLNKKQTTVRDIQQTYATFPTVLDSHYRLPLMPYICLFELQETTIDGKCATHKTVPVVIVTKHILK